jgi:hypothetical protein
MKELLNVSLEHGVAGICVLLTIFILMKVGEFVWAILKEKRALSEDSVKKLTKAVEDNTIASRHLEDRLKALEQSAADLPKFKTDVRRFYAAIKEVAGDRWPQIRDEILKDEFTL